MIPLQPLRFSTKGFSFNGILLYGRMPDFILINVLSEWPELFFEYMDADLGPGCKTN